VDYYANWSGLLILYAELQDPALRPAPMVLKAIKKQTERGVEFMKQYHTIVSLKQAIGNIRVTLSDVTDASLLDRAITHVKDHFATSGGFDAHISMVKASA
jgi:hypothetical protein